MATSISKLMYVMALIILSVDSKLFDSVCDCDLGIYAPPTRFLEGCRISIASHDMNSTCHDYEGVASLEINDCTDQTMRLVVYEGLNCTKNKELYAHIFKPNICYNLSLPLRHNHTLHPVTAELKCE
eukprot:334190_1